VNEATRNQKKVGTPAAALVPVLRWSAAVLLLCALYGQFSGLAGEPFNLFRDQDRQVVLLLSAMLFLLSLLHPPPLLRSVQPALRWPSAIGWSVAATALVALGTFAVMRDYAFTRDEEMAVFDALIFRSGHLTAAVPPEWRQFVPSLAPLYALRFPENAQWASAYLPGNAALRAGFSLLMDPAFLNPLLAGGGALLLFASARRLFPGSKSAQAVAFTLYLTSAQIAVTAMTPFAMTAHLAFNLLWLLLFLRGGRFGHVGAGVVGFIATGLHQLIFHPLFVAPFLFQLLRRKEWKPLVFYVGVYAAAGLFWMSYYGLVGGSIGAVHPSDQAGAAAFIRDRIIPMITTRDPATLPLMVFNLLRFAAWQNLAMVPLALVGIAAARRGDEAARPFYWGIVLTILAMAFLLPFQSNGWGYRYLHGLIGNFALLAGFGWQRVEQERRARLLLAAGTALTLFVSIPYLLWTTNRLIAPSVAAAETIDRLPADFVVIETDDVGPARDQARNDPFLRNRPLRFASSALRPSDVELLCRRGRLMFLGREDVERLGLAPLAIEPAPAYPSLERAVSGRPCVKAPPGANQASAARSG